MLTLISVPLIKCSVNFHHLNFHYFDSNFSMPYDFLDNYERGIFFIRVEFRQLKRNSVELEAA